MRKILFGILIFCLLFHGLPVKAQFDSSVKPEVEIRSDDVKIKVEYLPGTSTLNKYSLSENEIVWEGETEEVHFYKLPDSNDYDEAYEYEVILKQIPASNVFAFKVLGVGLDFFYQPALNKADYPKNFVVNQTHAMNGSVVVDNRPINIVGSYAVYDSSTGRKVFHIYRPLIIDAKGIKTYGELSYNRGILRVEVDANYLKTASYPVSIDPTFGKTDKGGSNTFNENNINTARFNLTHNANITSITIFLNKGAGTTNVTCNIYNSSALVPISPLGETDELLNWAGDRWVQFNYSSPLRLSFGTYHLSWWASVNARFYYDVGASKQWRRDAEAYGGAFTDPFVESAQAARAISIYANYDKLKNEGYGEDELNLGQFVDSFDNSGNVSIAVDVVNNSTRGIMELNQTSGLPVYQNFSAWNENDPQGEITVNETSIVWVTQERRFDGYVQGDYGASFFDDYEIFFTHELTDFEAGDASNNLQQLILYVTSATGTFNNIWAGTSIVLYANQDAANDDKVIYRLQARKGGANSFVDVDVSRDLAKYYIIFNRTGSDCGAYFFNDTNHINLIFSLTGTAFTDDLRYAGSSQSRFSATDGTDHTTGYIKDMNFFGATSSGYASTGWFNTTNYLLSPNASGAALVSMVNTSIPANTGITIEFSNDGSTWVDNEGIPGGFALSGGFESIDLRWLNYSAGFYSRFNLSTTDSTITPQVYQNRLITSQGPGGSAGGGVNRPTVLIVGGLITIIVAVFIGVKKR